MYYCNHRAVYGKVKTKMITRKKKNQQPDKTTQPKVNWINLRDPDKADLFVATVTNSFNPDKTYQYCINSCDEARI